VNSQLFRLSKANVSKPVEACSLSTHYACIYNFEYIYSG